MDAVAGPSAKQKLGRPLIPPNYVSLRHLQELRLKEEEQRQREEEEAAARVKEEQRRREEEEAAERRRVVEEQRRREEEEAAARRRVLEEQRRREDEEAAARRVKEAAAAAPMKPSSASNTSLRYKERPRGGQRSVVVAHRRPPPSRGEGTAMKSDGATGGCHGQKGPDGDAANAPLGAGCKPQNEGKGKGKDKVLPSMNGGSGEPTGAVTASLYGGKPEEKRKVEASGYQGTASGMSSAPGELGEAGIGSHRGSGRQKNKHKGKKGLDGRSTEIASSGMMGKRDSSPPRGVNSENIEKGLGEPHTGTASFGAPDVSPPSGVKSEKIGKKKPSEGMCADAVPSSNMRYRKTAQTRRTSRSNRRSSGGQGLMWEVKSEGLGEKQTVVEMSAKPQTSTEGCNNRRMEVKSENSGKKQLMVKVIAQPCPATEDSSNRRRDSGQGTILEAKSEGLDEKQPVVEVRATAQRKLWHVRHSHERRPGGGSGVAGEHGGVWVPKVTAARDSAEVRKFL